jgi:hypothetical protein
METGKDGPGTILPQFLEWAMVSLNFFSKYSLGNQWLAAGNRRKSDSNSSA